MQVWIACVAQPMQVLVALVTQSKQALKDTVPYAAQR